MNWYLSNLGVIYPIFRNIPEVLSNWLIMNEPSAKIIPDSASAKGIGISGCCLMLFGFGGSSQFCAPPRQALKKKGCGLRGEIWRNQSWEVMKNYSQAGNCTDLSYLTTKFLGHDKADTFFTRDSITWPKVLEMAVIDAQGRSYNFRHFDIWAWHRMALTKDIKTWEKKYVKYRVWENMRIINRLIIQTISEYN